MPKRFIYVLCGGLFCLVIFYLYDNILILDDFHTSYHHASQSYEQSSLEQPSVPLSEDSSFSISAKGYYIYVNLDIFTMYVYKDGEILKTYPVSGGGPSTPSPLGTWKIISKDTWGEGFGGAWLGFNVPWGKYGIHGTIYPWFIGKSNSSKGCIRMNNKDVAELYKLVPHGTAVTIIHKNKPFRILRNGDVGSDVLEVQKHLKELGYYTGYPDGIFGQGMTQAVKAFQRDYKLWESGTVTNETYWQITHAQKG
ncbi:L,D-transpeptidase family protein [Anaerobacterium chartisolvens]|uniref:L,D-transpeptidase family protein n=1 Tax=Anaerobacterium chartisolvens TaxID=1297424 RepID=UPI001FA8BA0B|nr:L,D-transpeptidase family protein [Anaerobacterium chartisolvens]